MGRLVESFVVVDSEWREFSRHGNNRNGARPADLRSEKPRRNAQHHHVCCESVEIGDVYLGSESGDLAAADNLATVTGSNPAPGAAGCGIAA